MPPDKFTATWVSHSSIGDFLVCPRAYFLKNVYKDPKTRHKIQVISPPLALGQAVHEVLESLSVLPTDQRFSEPLVPKLEVAWKKISGKKGGFENKAQEKTYFNRAKAMIKTVLDNPGPLSNLAVKINQDLPYYWISEDENIILCGKIDWLEYLPKSDSVHIVDFKTGRSQERPDSLQLPIYNLLVHNCQNRKVEGASYWYLDSNPRLSPQKLPDLKESHQQILKIAKEIKLARSLNRFKCPHNGCRACDPFEAVLRGEAEFVGVGGYNQDLYIVIPSSQNQEESVIL